MEVQSAIHSAVRPSGIEAAAKEKTQRTVNEANDQQKNTEPVSKKDNTAINTDGDTLEISPDAAESYKNDTKVAVSESAVNNMPKVSDIAAKSTSEVSAAAEKGTPEVTDTAAKSVPEVSDTAEKSTPESSVAAAKNTPKLTDTTLAKYPQGKLKQLLANKQITKKQYEKALKNKQRHEKADPKPNI